MNDLIPPDNQNRRPNFALPGAPTPSRTRTDNNAIPSKPGTRRKRFPQLPKLTASSDQTASSTKRCTSLWKTVHLLIQSVLPTNW